MLRGKNILVVCKEKYAYPMYFLIKELKQENHLGMYFLHTAECTYKECIYNTNTYYKFQREFPDVVLFDVKESSLLFLEKRIKLDISFLKRIEKDYDFLKNLNAQILSDQAFSRYYHGRYYYNNFSEEEKLLWLELNYKNTIKIIESFRPDMILDNNDETLQRTILNEVARKYKIPYINIDYPRLGIYKLATYKMGIGVDDYFKKKYEKVVSLKKEDLEDEYLYVNEFRKKDKIMSEEFADTVTSSYKKEEWKTIIISLYYYWRLYWNIVGKSGNFKLLKKKSVIFPNEKKHIMFSVKAMLKRQYLLGRNKYFSLPRRGEKYVYMPLHLIPESTTFVKAHYYINELELIEQISKSLPIGCYLYVKEHQAMLGEREFSFYEKINRLSNVRLVQLNYYEDPAPWIRDSIGVVTITGTSAYEAALMGKKSIIFGETPFMLLEGVNYVSQYKELPFLLTDMVSQPYIDNIHSCASYIKAVKEEGKEINLHYLISKSELIINGTENIDEKFVKTVKNYIGFYSEAYDLMDDRLER